jgi:hypothetical protein
MLFGAPSAALSVRAPYLFRPEEDSLGLDFRDREGETNCHRDYEYQSDAQIREVVLFLVLKTVADVIMHLVEHRETPQSQSPPVGKVDEATVAKWVKRVKIALAGVVGGILFLVLWIAFAGTGKWPATICPLLALGAVAAITAIVYGLFWITSLPIMEKRNSPWGNIICVLVGLVIATILFFVLESVTSVSRKHRPRTEKASVEQKVEAESGTPVPEKASYQGSGTADER